MVDRTIYSLEFRRMVAKAYFTSSKSLSEIGKEFNVKMTTVHTMGSPLWAGIWSAPILFGRIFIPFKLSPIQPA